MARDNGGRVAGKSRKLCSLSGEGQIVTKPSRGHRPSLSRFRVSAGGKDSQDFGGPRTLAVNRIKAACLLLKAGLPVPTHLCAGMESRAEGKQTTPLPCLPLQQSVELANSREFLLENQVFTGACVTLPEV